MQLGLPFGADSSALPAPSASPSLPAPHGSADLQFLFVRNRRARRYLVRVDPEGHARVTIPRGGSKREAGEFAARHLGWIHRQRARLLQERRAPLTDVERRTVQDRAAQELPLRLAQLAQRLDCVVSRVSVRNQRARWGSCGRDGHICLNWRLVLMPDWVRDYVLIHELMHLRRMDHSPAYWQLVAAACPSYEEARRWLREHGGSLR